MHLDERTRFHHLRDENNNMRGTVAYKVALNSEGLLVLGVGVSFCNPRDNFNKSKGRKIAEGRMDVRPVILELLPDKLEELRLGDVAELATTLAIQHHRPVAWTDELVMTVR